MESIQEEFDYLHQVIKEAFRLNPPQPESSWLTLKQDAKIGSM